MLRHRQLILHALPCVLGFAAPVRAQTTVDAGPIAGYYRPFGRFDPASVYFTSLPENPSDLRGVAWGGAMHIGVGRRLGAEAQVSVANSTIPAVSAPGGPRGPTRARVTMVTTQAQYDVSRAPERYRLWLSAGPAVIRHGGDAYAPHGSPVSVGGAFGVSTTWPSAGHLRIAAGATTLLYSFDVKMPPELQRNPGSLQHAFRTDALIHLGLRWGPS